MKLSNWALPLALFSLFAISTQAQNQAVQLPTQAHRPPQATAGSSPRNPEAAAKAKRDATRNANVSPDATMTCSYTFTTGSGITYLKYCVTVNGNITQFQSPVNVELIDQDGSGEGYGICDESTNTPYYDYAYADSGNWGAPTTVTSTATLVRIERTTTDGAWTLTQTITKVAGTNPYAKITMALKNNSGMTKVAILLRYVNAEPDDGGSSGDLAENYDGTLDSAWGYIPTIATYGSDSGPYGLMVQNVGVPTPAGVLLVQEGFAIPGFFGPNTCDAGSSFIGTLVHADGSDVYVYELLIKKEQTATVNVKYFSF